MFHRKIMDEGLGQLEAYAGGQDGVALKMDNEMFWNSMAVEDHKFGIQGVYEKCYSCKFLVTVTEPGKVVLRDCMGWFLAPKLLAECYPIYPLQPAHRNWEASSEFRVFHKGNKVAFQTHDGRFLTRSFRGVYIVEACKTCVDSGCFFQPEIGRILAPDYRFINVFLGDLSKLRCRSCVVKKDTFVNQTEKSLSHNFMLTWAEKGIQRTAWQRRWGLGLTIIGEFTIMGMKAIIKYNQDNDKVVYTPQPIFETFAKKIKLPPRTKATARLMVDKENNVTIPFVAKIRKVRPGGTVERLYELGIWKGLVYHSPRLEVKVEPLGTLYTVM